MDGLLLIDKPKGWTSFDVVAKVRGILKKSGLSKPKVGHTGTLDPLASGLLVLTLGTYCKKAQEYSKLDKVYEVEMCLGKTSTTDDAEGIITSTKKPIPDPLLIKSTMADFTGKIEQVPPAFSAIKVKGKRAYKLAREGKEVKLEPRKVTIYSIENVKIIGSKVSFTAKVSSGTYIRSIVRDVGEKLDVGAYMRELRRTQIGNFDIKHAQQIDSLNSQKIHESLLE
jgi:tRNA pseudouridine55 synthase